MSDKRKDDDKIDAVAVKQRIIAAALEVGFDVCRFASTAVEDARGEGLRSFLKAGHHGQMNWMAERVDERSAPKNLWSEAESVMMLGMNYGPPDNPLDGLHAEGNGLISVYAQRRDYHDVIKKKLKQLARLLVAETGAEVKVFVDTAPVMEKPLAQQAGLGWQGKHTNLVSRELGSWLFLGSIFTTLKLAPDAEESDHCGTCSACLDVCPTDAFPAPYKLDARRCISYLTIEHKGMIDADLRPLMGNHIYGCDDCLAVCPWNKYAKASHETKLALNEDMHLPDLLHLVTLDEAAFRSFFAGTPIKRSGRDNFIRNVLIALGNMSEPTLAHRAAVAARLDDSAAVVRAHAVWALARLDMKLDVKLELSLSSKSGEATAKSLAPSYMSRETDMDVRAEWHAVLEA